MAGNWKMYKTPKEAVEYVKVLRGKLADAKGCEILVCPPAVAIAGVAEALRGSNIRVGAQDAHYNDEGAFTGNLSPVMLKEVGAEYVILGHSERRQYEKETDETVNRKAKNVLKAGMKAIVCVGETLQEREAGRTQAVVEAQVKGCFSGIPEADLKNVVIAYEPVWAIGTGKTATPQQANEVHAAIRHLIGQLHGAGAAEAMRIQYGGSVKPDNVKELMSQPDIDGALVGGASLKADSWEAIVRFQ
jgi:triosephosphate isomerase